jgi:hypothetical protein
MAEEADGREKSLAEEENKDGAERVKLPEGVKGEGCVQKEVLVSSTAVA